MVFWKWNKDKGAHKAEEETSEPVIEDVKYPRYKIVPYDMGFSVELHEIQFFSPDIYIKQWIKVTDDDGSILFNFIGHGGFVFLSCETVVFKTKESAKSFIDSQVKKKQKQDDMKKARIKHAQDNPPEWYP